MTSTSETRLLTRKNIIDSFWQLYKSKGANAITVKDVVKKAGYNRSTFYEYFMDLSDVLETIELSLIPTIDSLPPMDLEDLTIGMPIDEFLELFKVNQEYYLVLLGEHGDPSFASKLKKRIKSTFLSHLEFKDNFTSKHSDFAIEFILSGMIGILMYWLSSPKTISEHEVILLIREMMPSINPKP